MNLNKLLSVFGMELNNIGHNMRLIFQDMLPKKVTSSMIDAWESAYGLTSDNGLTVENRRAILLAKVRATGGQSVEFFYQLAEAKGYNRHPSTTDPHIQITTGDFPAFRAGISAAGDKVYDGTTGASIYTWKVKGTSVSTDTALQSLFNQLKPAHTEIIFEDA